MEITEKELLEYNRLGFIPGPEESTVDFLRRVHYCLFLKEQLASQTDLEMPFESNSPEILEEVFPITKKWYDIAPNWISISFSNYRLGPWHGGCAWIIQLTDDTPTAAFLQLRRSFKKSQRVLGLYQRQELIAHELAHVGRMMFDEPKFEEFFAYQTSPSRFRRWFGPIVKSSFESILFLLTLLVLLFVDFSLIVTGYTNAYQVAMLLKLIPLGLISFALIRLTWKHHQFSKCQNKLKEIVTHKHDVIKLMFRLKDNEIIDFGKMDKKDILKYVQDQKVKSLRWRLLTTAYHQNCFL